MDDTNTPNPDDVGRDGAALFERIKTTPATPTPGSTGWTLEVQSDGGVVWHCKAREQDHDGTISFFADTESDKLICATVRGGRVTYLWMRPGKDGHPPRDTARRATPRAPPTSTE